MYSLGAYDGIGDYVELNRNDTREMFKTKIDNIYHLTKANACNYCDSGSENPEYVLAGE